MKIINDIVEFEAADVEQLSAEIQAALAAYNSGVSAEETVSGVINSFIALAHSVSIARSVDTVKVALLEATPAERADANVKLDEAKVILGVQFNPKEEIAALTFDAVAVK